MARIRSLKPGFFTNEHLAELPFEARLCFAGLWTLADREGRLEDRPRRIKAALFPYDDLDIDAVLNDLARKAFIIRYVADGAAYIAIPTFHQHQRPKTDEYPSAIPAPSLEVPRGISPDRARIKDIGTEDRGQRTEGEGADGALIAADGAGLSETADGVEPRPTAEDFANLWNALTGLPIPRCRDITTKRRRHIRARLTERSLTEWTEVFERIQRSPFCRGENDRGWAASFDWVVGSPDVAVKVLEGKYDDRRALTRQKADVAVASHDWACPHSPKCTQGRWKCERLSQIQAFKGNAAS